jgi:hypothetical protein
MKWKVLEWSIALSLVSLLRHGCAYEMNRVVRVAEDTWREAAKSHERKIRNLLLPGLLPQALSSRQSQRLHANLGEQGWTALDTKHPIYNFLIEYYGLKGAKGPKRLARWSPALSLLLQRDAPVPCDAGILLEGAREDDFASVLHVRGASIESEGILYSPGLFFGKGDSTRRDEAARAATPFIWYRDILQQTLSAEPIVHCHGLHEFAMQYQPKGAPPPPSGKYQSHLSLRLEQSVINEAVERKGISCTHVDALRFFAPAAGPLNHHGSKLIRTDQLRLEQPACVHAQMDLLKIALRLQPFCGAELVERILDVALRARRLDVAASPYDASAYGVDVVPVETPEGRAMYRKEQIAQMKAAEPIRRQLLKAYDEFLLLAFDEAALQTATEHHKAERFAQAEPGGLPWRKNLVNS